MSYSTPKPKNQTDEGQREAKATAPIAAKRDHLEGLEKDANPLPDPNWLGCATAVVSTGVAFVTGRLVEVRTAAVLVLEHIGVSVMVVMYKNGHKRTRWLCWWRWWIPRYDFAWWQTRLGLIGTNRWAHHSGESRRNQT